MSIFTPPSPSEMSGEQLAEQMVSLSSSINAATYQLLVLIGEYDSRELFAPWECPDMVAWLQWHLSIGPGAARDHVRIARALRGLPKVSAVFERGEVSYSKIRAITRVASPATEEFMLDLAKYMTASELERFVGGHRRTQRDKANEEANDRHAQRTANWWWDEDGSLVINVRVAPEDGVVVVNAWEAATQDIVPASVEGDDRHLEAKRNRADAFVEMCRASTAAGAARSDAGAAEVVVEVDGSVLQQDARNSAELQETCRVQNGPALAPDSVLRMLCDGPVQALLRNNDNITMGRRTRRISRSLRRALMVRDGQCMFPGCAHHRYLDAHHIQHWAHGGTTDLENLVLLCRTHHRAMHEGGYAVTASFDGGFTFNRKNGSFVSVEPPPLTPAQKLSRFTGPVAPDAAQSHWQNDPVDYSYISSLAWDIERHAAAVDPRNN